VAVIREDRELLAELARLNTAMTPLAMRIMDGSASAAEQQNYAQQLIAAGERLRRRVDRASGAVVEGEVLADISIALPARTVEPNGRSSSTCNTMSDSAPAGRGDQSGFSPSAYGTPLSGGVR
jgi:hypothetical protein